MKLKFENVDVLDALSKIMELHTQHYKEDFDLDKELIRKLAGGDDPEYKHLLWMSRPCGTYCLLEREVYLQETYENNVWKFYHEQTKDTILAYALQLNGIEDGKVIGTIYPLDYHAHVERVKLLSCPIAEVTVRFEDGTQSVLPYQSRRQGINELVSKHGNAKAMRYAPESERELAVILRRERFKRDYHAKPGNIQEHIKELEKGSLRGQLKAALTEIPAEKDVHNKGKLER